MRGRVADWRTRLIEWAISQNGRPFAWGVTDCATLARGALAQCFGADVAAFIPSWASAREAAERVAQHPIEETLTRLGATRVALNFVRAGDVVVAPEPLEVGGVAILVCVDASHFLASSGVDGVRIVDQREVPNGSVAYSLWEVPSDG